MHPCAQVMYIAAMAQFRNSGIIRNSPRCCKLAWRYMGRHGKHCPASWQDFARHEVTRLDKTWRDVARIAKTWQDMTRCRLGKTWQAVERHGETTWQDSWHALTRPGENWQNTWQEMTWGGLATLRKTWHDVNWQELTQDSTGTWEDLASHDKTWGDLLNKD